MMTRILERKLSFLQHVMEERASQLSSVIKRSLCDGITSLCLVKECCFLKEYVGTGFTKAILKGSQMEEKRDSEC